jgi:arginine decarboxylase
MLERHEFPVLFIAGPERRHTASQTLSRIVEELVDLGHRVVEAETLTDGRALVSSDPSFGAVLLDWDVSDENGDADARAVLDATRLRSDHLPVFLMLDHGDATDLSLDVLETAREVVLVLQDTPAFIAGRIDFAWRRYTDTLLPPFFGALVEFANTYEYSMHTPGHAGGAAFRKTPVGKAFYDYYGENLFRSDLSVSVAELGSLLDHSGPVAESERNAARVFGADMSCSPTATATNRSTTRSRSPTRSRCTCARHETATGSSARSPQPRSNPGRSPTPSLCTRWPASP